MIGVSNSMTEEMKKRFKAATSPTVTQPAQPTPMQNYTNLVQTNLQNAPTQTDPITGLRSDRINRVQTEQPKPAARFGAMAPKPTVAEAPAQSPVMSTQPQKPVEVEPSIGPVQSPPIESPVTSTLPPDPGQMTEAGKLYADRVTKGLQGTDPRVTNAQQTEDTAAARRAYTARKNTEESLGQSQFAPGSAQYQRALDQSQAGVDTANLQGQQNVNANTRAITEANMNRAQGLENEQYSRGQTERTHGETQTLQAKREAESLINSVEDPKAKYYLNTVRAQGGDVNAAYAEMFENNGTIKEGYRSQTDVQNVQSNAEDWIKATRSDLVKGTPEYQKAVTDRMAALDEATQRPLSNQQQEQTKKDIETKIGAGQDITPEDFKAGLTSGAIKELNPASAPGMDKTLIGKTFSVGGSQYKVVESSRVGKPGSHTGFHVLQSPDGTIKYMYNKQLTDTPPYQSNPSSGPAGDLVWDPAQQRLVIQARTK